MYLRILFTGLHKKILIESTSNRYYENIQIFLIFLRYLLFHYPQIFQGIIYYKNDYIMNIFYNTYQAIPEGEVRHLNLQIF